MTKTTLSILLFALLFGVFFWIMDGLLTFHLFHEPDRFLSPETTMTLKEHLLWGVSAHDLSIRIIFILTSLTAGIFIAIFMARRRRIEVELRNSEERMNAIFSATPDPVVVYDQQGYPKYINPAFSQIFGWKLEELKGRHIPFVPAAEKERSLEQIKLLYTSGRPVRFETKRVNRHGKELDILISAAIVMDSTGNRSGMVVNLTDMTERKRLEEELQHAHKMEAIGTLAGGIAHEFNNILGIIIGNAELALGDIHPHHATHGYLEKIEQAGLRARDVVRQLLSFSRKTVHRKIALKLQVTIAESIRLLRASIPSSIRIETHLDAKTTVIFADPTQIHQIMINLGSNAAHAMEENGGILSVRLTEMVLPFTRHPRYLEMKPGRYAQLSIHDTGHGIDPEIQARIFDPYFTTKEVNKGTGLGLAVVHGIVRDHDGHITVQSTPDIGTRVEILFPLTELVPLSENPGTAYSPSGGNQRIMLVDDEEAIAEMVHRILEKAGYRVTPFTDAVQALEKFRADPQAFDLIITDLTMPGLTGDHLAKAALSLRSDIPVILCSGFSERVNREQALAMGIKQYLRKPFDMRQLTAAVSEVLNHEHP